MEGIREGRGALEGEIVGEGIREGRRGSIGRDSWGRGQVRGGGGLEGEIVRGGDK